jgi:hypothetical protein
VTEPYDLNEIRSSLDAVNKGLAEVGKDRTAAATLVPEALVVIAKSAHFITLCIDSLEDRIRVLESKR